MANLTLLDLDKEWTVDTSLFKSKGKSTPYDGMTLTGAPVATVSNGELVFTDL